MAQAGARMEGRVGRSREAGVRTCRLSGECGLSRRAMGVVVVVLSTPVRGPSPIGSGLSGLRLGARSPGPGEHRLFEEREAPGQRAQAPLLSPLQPWQRHPQRLPRPPLSAKGPSQDLNGEFLREVSILGRPCRQGLASLLEPLQRQCRRRGRKRGDAEVEGGRRGGGTGPSITF